MDARSLGMCVRSPLSYGVINMALLLAHSDLPGLCHTMQIKCISLGEQGQYLSRTSNTQQGSGV